MQDAPEHPTATDRPGAPGTGTAMLPPAGVVPAPGFVPEFPGPWPSTAATGRWQHPYPPVVTGMPPMRPVDGTDSTDARSGGSSNRTIGIVVGVVALAFVAVIALGLLRNGATDNRNIGEILLDGVAVLSDFVFGVLRELL